MTKRRTKGKLQRHSHVFLFICMRKRKTYRDTPHGETSSLNSSAGKKNSKSISAHTYLIIINVVNHDHEPVVSYIIQYGEILFSIRSGSISMSVENDEESERYIASARGFESDENVPEQTEGETNDDDDDERAHER